MDSIIIDVREKEEFLAERVHGSINIPLTDFASHAPAVLHQLADRDLVFMCRNGTRARLAVNSLFSLNVLLPKMPEVYTGGIKRWKQEGHAVERFRASRLPILRQTHVGAGIIVLVGVILSLLVHPSWIALSAFAGAGLTLAGLTGFCGMAILLQWMPWNRIDNTSIAASKQQQNVKSD